MSMRKIEPDEMKQLLKEIKELSSQAKKHGKDDYSTVTSKDVLFYFLAQFSDLEKRVVRVETTQKNLCYFLGIVLSIIAISVAVIRLS